MSSSLEKLKAARTIDDFAAMLGFKPSALAFLVYKLPPSQKYRTFDIPKRNGGMRTISAPEPRLKTLQKRLANVLYACRDEIDKASGLPPLSHGFRKKHSIVTNARPHKRRRHVLNLDLQDFFPSFNFGRVRGFFSKNRHFALNEKIATLVAQVACHNNELPQGSPCSPIISDLIAHPMDVRLAQLAKKHRLTYSRYADDLTFSTGQKQFPGAVASPDPENPTSWLPGRELAAPIVKAGFRVHPDKTRMQFSVSRQVVTGLTVNEKVNIRKDYYRYARVMCNSVFHTGSYVRPKSFNKSGNAAPITSLSPLEGILSHIHYVKTVGAPGATPTDEEAEPPKQKEHKAASGTRLLHKRFLLFRYFVCPDRPIIVCEGKTDNVYLSLAIRHLPQFQPRLGAPSGKHFQLALSLFSYRNEAHKILDLYGSSSWLKPFIETYAKQLQRYRYQPLAHPVIVLIDNDDGASEIFAMLKKRYNITMDWKSSQPFYHVTANLYVIKTPEGEGDGNGKSAIEDAFDKSVTDTVLDGKKFNANKKHKTDGEYGKHVFAEKVVRARAAMIDFQGFAPLLNRIVAAIDDYAKRRSN
ncbi:MAG: retron Ec67 family RNA-directed DNA polymerase/endonuclease [Hyphomicrobiaceae bacterium]